jgi:hypothetical protein
MEVMLFGRGCETLLAEFDSAGIQYERWVPRPWQIMNAGFWARIAENHSRLALAKVLVAWVRGSDSRKVSITQNDNSIFHIEGMSAEAVEKILPLCRNIMASDRSKTDQKGDAS